MDSLTQIWAENAKKYGKKHALINEDLGISFTYSDLYDHIKKLASFFQALGIEKTNHIALLAETSPTWVALDQAIMTTGSVCVCRGSSLPIFELEYIYNHSDSCALITDKKELLEHFLFVLNPDTCKFILYTGKEPLPEYKDTNIRVFNLEEALKIGTTSELKKVEISPQDIAVLSYTSGTSGSPKAAMLTHGNLASQIVTFHNRVMFKPEKKVISLLPIWHAGPRMFDFYFLSIGSTIYQVSFKNYLNSLKTHHHDYFSTVPKVLESLYSAFNEEIKSKGFFFKLFFNFLNAISRQYKNALRKIRGLDSNCSVYSNVKKIQNYLTTILFLPIHYMASASIYRILKKEFLGNNGVLLCGSATLRSEVEEFFESIDLDLLLNYGLTEASPFLTVSVNKRKRLNSVGPALDDTIIKIIDPITTEQLSYGRKGLILAKGPQIMHGYYKNEEDTKKTILQDGFLNTGDMGFLCEDGYLTISGRHKDLIVLSNGENIEPIFLEMACLEISDIAQIVVVGQDKPYLTALLVLNDSSINKISSEFEINGDDIFFSEKVKVKLLEELNKKISSRKNFRYFERIRNLIILKEHFSFESGTLTSLSKLKRNVVCEEYKAIIEKMYQ